MEVEFVGGPHCGEILDIEDGYNSFRFARVSLQCVADVVPAVELPHYVIYERDGVTWYGDRVLFRFAGWEK